MFINSVEAKEFDECFFAVWFAVEDLALEFEAYCSF